MSLMSWFKDRRQGGDDHVESEPMEAAAPIADDSESAGGGAAWEGLAPLAAVGETMSVVVPTTPADLTLSRHRTVLEPLSHAVSATASGRIIGSASTTTVQAERDGAALPALRAADRPVVVPTPAVQRRRTDRVPEDDAASVEPLPTEMAVASEAPEAMAITDQDDLPAPPSPTAVVFDSFDAPVGDREAAVGSSDERPESAPPATDLVAGAQAPLVGSIPLQRSVRDPVTSTPPVEPPLNASGVPTGPSIDHDVAARSAAPDKTPSSGPRPPTPAGPTDRPGEPLIDVSRAMIVDAAPAVSAPSDPLRAADEMTVSRRVSAEPTVSQEARPGAADVDRAPDVEPPPRAVDISAGVPTDDGVPPQRLGLGAPLLTPHEPIVSRDYDNVSSTPESSAPNPFSVERSTPTPGISVQRAAALGEPVPRSAGRPTAVPEPVGRPAIEPSLAVQFVRGTADPPVTVQPLGITNVGTNEEIGSVPAVAEPAADAPAVADPVVANLVATDPVGEMAVGETAVRSAPVDDARAPEPSSDREAASDHQPDIIDTPRPFPIEFVTAAPPVVQRAHEVSFEPERPALVEAADAHVPDSHAPDVREERLLAVESVTTGSDRPDRAGSTVVSGATSTPTAPLVSADRLVTHRSLPSIVVSRQEAVAAPSVPAAAESPGHPGERAATRPTPSSHFVQGQVDDSADLVPGMERPEDDVAHDPGRVAEEMGIAQRQSDGSVVFSLPNAPSWPERTNSVNVSQPGVVARLSEPSSGAASEGVPTPAAAQHGQGASPGSAPGDLSKLVEQIYDQIERRIRRELLAERERKGSLVEVR